jgi:site-specific recombinase XerD
MFEIQRILKLPPLATNDFASLEEPALEARTYQAGYMLESFIADHSSNTRHTLVRFRDSLATSSEHTVRAYTTHVWSFLINKLSYYWDFDQKYNPAANALAFLQTLVNLDLELQELKFTSAEQINNKRYLDQIAEKLLSNTEHCLAELENANFPNKLQRRFNFKFYSNRFSMSLRTDPHTSQNEIQPEIDKRDKLILNFLFQHFDNLLDQGFWSDIFRSDNIGQVLSIYKQKECSNSTLALKMSALKKFEEFVKFDVLNLSPDSTPIALERMRQPRRSNKPQRFLDEGQIKYFFDFIDQYVFECQNGTKDREPLLAVRDRAILYLLAGSLVRANELCTLKLDSINLKDRTILIKQKGGEQSIKTMAPKTFEVLQEYLGQRNKFANIYAQKEGHKNALFTTVRGLSMNRRSLLRITKNYAELAGLGNLKNHDLRRSVANQMCRKGAALDVVQEILGHKNSSTTNIYLAQPNTKHCADSMEKFHPFS